MMPWFALMLGAPLTFYAYERFGRSNRRFWIKMVLLGIGIILFSIALGAAGLCFKAGKLSIFWYSIIYLSYCLAVSVVLCIRPIFWRSIAMIIAVISLIPGYILATVGFLGYMFIAQDIVEPSVEVTAMGDGLVCESTSEGIAGVSESESISLYQNSAIPFFRWPLTSNSVDPTDSAPSCESLLRQVTS